MTIDLDDEQDIWLERNGLALVVVAGVTAMNYFRLNINPPQSIVAGNNGVDHSQFVLVNTIGFLSSMTVMMIFTGGLHGLLGSRFIYWIVKVLMLIIIACMALTYTYVVIAATPPESSALLRRLTNLLP
ncbi:hypothetical protein BT93_J1340 [Corymbia citriodora subsp. variegata]|nr:hypothetical protein BT93_J1340 [Corymbia citriodora subsp. variegata]